MQVKYFNMAQYRFIQPYELRQQYGDGSIGILIKAFSVGDIIDGTFGVNTAWDGQRVPYVESVYDGRVFRISPTYVVNLTPGTSADLPGFPNFPNVGGIPTPVKAFLGLAAIFCILKVAKVI